MRPDFLYPYPSLAPTSVLMVPPERDATAKSFRAVSPARYRHPSDLAAHKMLTNNGGVDELVRLFSEHVQERAARVDNLSNFLRLGPRQLPGLHAICLECCERLGVDQEIEFFLGTGFNAWTSGVEQPHVVIGHDLLAAATTPAALRFVIGHELGHVLSQHVHYHQVARWALAVSESIPVVGGLLRRGLDMALYDWYRSAEFTADRAGLLACQDIDAAIHLLMVFAGFPPYLADHVDLNSCVEQEVAFSEESKHPFSRIMRFRAEVFMDHPWPVVRVAELHKWRESRAFTELSEVESLPPTQGIPLKAEAARWPCDTPGCDGIILPGQNFCTRCGHPAARAPGGIQS